MTGRIVIEAVMPRLDGNHPAKTTVGEYLPISAVIWREGHLPVSAEVELSPPDGAPVETVAMRLSDPGTDTWEAAVVPDRVGRCSFQVRAWHDPWRHWLATGWAKTEAGSSPADLRNSFETGARLVDRMAATADQAGDTPTAAGLTGLAAELRDHHRPAPERLRRGGDEAAMTCLARYPLREQVTTSDRYEIYVDRARAQFGAWYEVFPRSTGGFDQHGEPVHGSLRTALADLPRIAAMGFDVIYLTPIHPIGHAARKGRNNTVAAQPGEPGCPWAIGSSDGGHDAIAKELGDLCDFDAYLAAARDLGLEIAMDVALQCSPDHPWVSAHPEWFTIQPDGTIACAENPPRTWHDIHPLNFDQDPEGLYAEVLRVLRHWIDRGVHAFRVDNPHTKPVDFWTRLIWDIKRSHPDVLFLAEAFTKPAQQRGLSKLGFSQTYTYFTWRTSKAELTQFGEELVRLCDLMRPSLWPTTHDVLPFHLHHAPPAMFAIRAALAATLAPSWGIYSGYELFEGAPLRPDGESYLDSEKYQVRARDFAASRGAGRSLEGWLTTLNRIRRAHPALQQLRTLRFHRVDCDELIAYSKRDPITGDTVLCIVTLAADRVVSGTLTLDPSLLGGRDELGARDEVTGERIRWAACQRVELDPSRHVAKILSLDLKELP